MEELSGGAQQEHVPVLNDAADYLIDAVLRMRKDGEWKSKPLPANYTSFDTLYADAIEAVAHDAYKSLPYQEYLRTKHWFDVRTDAIERARRACQLCNTANVTLDVHHRTYARLGRERQDDVIVLCRDCHAKFHDKLP